MGAGKRNQPQTSGCVKKAAGVAISTLGENCPSCKKEIVIKGHLFHCFHCCASGNAIQFYMSKNKCSFEKAVMELCK